LLGIEDAVASRLSDQLADGRQADVDRGGNPAVGPNAPRMTGGESGLLSLHRH
jgi:hypothetical protein